MKLPACLLAARTPQNESIVPFKEILPLKLKNSVSGKSGRMTEHACLQEMSVLFACLKDNDFSDSFCSKEISTFQGCYKSYMDRSFKAKQAKHQGISVGRKLTFQQLNKFLRGFPSN